MYAKKKPARYRASTTSTTTATLTRDKEEEDDENENPRVTGWCPELACLTVELSEMIAYGNV